MNLGQTLAVSVFLLVAFTAFLLEYNHLFAFQVFENGGFDQGAVYIRSAHTYFFLVIGKQNFIKSYRCSGFYLKPVYEDFFSLLNSKLLACNVYNCVHKILLSVSTVSGCAIGSTFWATPVIKGLQR